jgi:ABC-2 type transport system permease protein
MLVVVAVADAILGTSLGLLASGFARTEFQAVQLMPAIVLPQFFLCGLLVSRDALPPVLGWLSNLMPLSYAVDAMHAVSSTTDPAVEVTRNLGIIIGFTVAALVLGSLTLRRRTP